MSNFKLEEVTYSMSGYSPGFKIIDNNIDIEDIEREDGSIAYLHGIDEDAAKSIVIALEKQMSRKATRDSYYSPALCPNCHTDEICINLGDGYYKYFTEIDYCPRCGQLLDWD